jgi:hypothetical protein
MTGNGSRRVRRWLIGIALFVVLILTVPHFVAISSGPYRLAVTTANARPEFSEALGPPIREAWFSEGTTRYGERASADLLIPVQGRKSKGNLRVLAAKDQGNWRLKELTLDLSQPEKRIDLLWNPVTGDYSKRLVDQLIDDLTLIDSRSPGINSTAVYGGFIADNTAGSFRMGVLGPPPPTVPPQMSELVRRGPRALPELIRHLDDGRPTKLEVGDKPPHEQIGVDTFAFMDFSDEYDPRIPHWYDEKERKLEPWPMEKAFSGTYTVKVADVCYVLVGQIVNRELLAVRYQPTAGLTVNSPIEAPSLAEKVRNDWGHADAETLRQSLLEDIHATNQPKRISRADYTWRFVNPALVRLRFYFPDTYSALQGEDLKKRTEFEDQENKERLAQSQ